jgi:hypothetical protein
VVTLSKLVWLAPIAALGGSAEVFAKGNPQESPSTLLVRVESAAKFIGFPQACLGSTADENEDEAVCLAELYEAKVKVLRHLGGGPTPQYLTVRFTAHSYHAVWQRNVRFLIVAAPFEDKGRRGHFASFWDWENEKARFCEEQETIAGWGLTPLARLYAEGSPLLVQTDNDEWSAGSSIVCVTGREPLVP